MSGIVYLDSAATAGFKYDDNIIIDTITSAMKKYWQNPSSLYASNVKEEINRCRANIGCFINAKSDEIYFTSGASESNNWVIRGWTDNIKKCTYKVPHIITTFIEHKSISESVQNPSLMANVSYCRVDNEGLIDIVSLENILKLCEDNPILVTIGLANNEIGTIQNIKNISELVHKYNGVIHIDATQAFGHIPINVEELCVDMMSASGHKISPVLKGVGFLYKKNCINICPLIYGSQEQGLRGGTENTFGIIGFSKAVDLIQRDRERQLKLEVLRNNFISQLKFIGCKINGSIHNRLPNNINVTFPQNITGESLLYTLDLSDVKISVGSACNSHSISPSHVLKAIGLTDEESMKTVRFTLPDNITSEDIDYVFEEICKAIKIIES